MAIFSIFDPKMTFADPLDDLEMDTIVLRRKFPIDPYHMHMDHMHIRPEIKIQIRNPETTSSFELLNFLLLNLKELHYPWLMAHVMG